MLITEHLARRVAHDGAAPLLTHYDLDAGSRTELSATTFDNWVAKAANLCLDELDLEAGDAVAMPLLGEQPGHWMSLVWVMAVWSCGGEVRPDRPASPDDTSPDGPSPGPAPEPVAVVVGPVGSSDPRLFEVPVLACSLHPLGLGFTEPLPDGWLDWSAEVRSQPDQFGGVAPTPDLAAWRDPERTLDQATVAAEAGGAGRRLVRPSTPWETVAAALVGPLVGGGSVVVVSGGSEEDVARVAADERVDGDGRVG